MVKKNPKTSNWIIVILILLSLYLLSAILANFVSLFSAVPETPSGNVAIIPIKGAIMSDAADSAFGISTMSSTDIIGLIEKAEAEKTIKAVIFEINSPGGSAVASEELVNAIASMNKTSVAWIREVGASGAYWAASATDHIVASRMSATGSIGVLSSYIEVAGFLQEHNVTYRSLTAGEFKEMQSPFKELTPEEEKLILARLDKVHDYFIDSVLEFRGIDASDDFTEGQILLGSEALELGLIDEIGSKDQAVEHIEKELNITADLARYEMKKNFLEMLGTLSANHGYFLGKGIGDLEIPGNLAVKT
ncbi:signal peptide peptidase SppA [Nanoarchaeota archaeon]